MRNRDLLIWAWQYDKRRPNWDEYFMMIAQVTATRSTCDRGPSQLFSNHRGTGAVVVSPDHRSLATGYNGSPPGLPHCDDSGHLMHQGSCKRTIHAEENAIHNATFDVKGCTIYTTTFPCYDCAKRIIQNGIIKVVYLNEYKPERSPNGLDIFKEAGIEIYKLNLNYSDGPSIRLCQDDNGGYGTGHDGEEWISR